MMVYDSSNPFARIIRGDIEVVKSHEDAHALAFPDIQPQAPVHVLVIPKGSYTNFSEFAEKATDAEIAAWVRAIGAVARQKSVAESGYRIIVNQGHDAGQQVPHLHAHVVGGQHLGPILDKIKE